MVKESNKLSTMKAQDSGSNHPAEIAVLKQLQKCFNEIQAQHARIVKSIREVSATLERVSNLSEQLSCCKRVDVRSTPLAKFPDVSERIQHTIMAAIEEKLTTVATAVEELHGGAAQVKRTSLSCMTVYRQHSDHLSFQQISEEQACRPSMATMLEWTQDSQHDFNKEYSRRYNLLHNVNYEDSASIERLVTSWKSTPFMEQLTEEILPGVSLFLKEEL